MLINRFITTGLVARNRKINIRNYKLHDCVCLTYQPLFPHTVAHRIVNCTYRNVAGRDTILIVLLHVMLLYVVTCVTGSRLSICRSRHSCCSPELEEGLHARVRQDFQGLLHHSSRTVQGLLYTTATTLHGMHFTFT